MADANRRVMVNPSKKVARGAQTTGVARVARPKRYRSRKGLVGNLDVPAHEWQGDAPCQLWVEDSLGADGDALAGRVAGHLGDALAALAEWFAVDAPKDFVCIIAELSAEHDGTGGAYHATCEDKALYCDAAYQDDGSRTSALFVAEASEVMQAQQKKGWNCGASNGEGLSRVHAEVAFPHALDDYTTAAAWLDGDRTDFVSLNDPTDTNPEANGCAVLFIFWLMSQGYDLGEITAAGGDTLATLATNLGEDRPEMFRDFAQLCEDRWPHGQDSGVTTDNPWLDAPAPTPAPPPDAGGLQPGEYTLVPGVWTFTVEEGGGGDSGLPLEVVNACKGAIMDGAEPFVLAEVIADIGWALGGGAGESKEGGKRSRRRKGENGGQS